MERNIAAAGLCAHRSLVAARGAGKLGLLAGAGLGLALGLAIVVGGAQEAAAQEVRANLNHEMTGSVIDDAVKQMAEALAERSDGRIDITVHSRGEMGGERAMYDLMQAGAIEMGVSGAAIISAVAPEFGVLDTPYLLVSSEHLNDVVSGDIGDELRQSVLENKGIRILAWMDRPPRHITTSGRAIRTPGDLNGLKIRTREIPVQVEAFRMLGASPVPMAFGEVYTALQTGVIDAQENPLEITLGSSFHEVQDHVILTGHVRELQWLIASDLWWQTLSAEDQVLVTEAAEEFMAWGTEQVYAEDERLLEEARERGMTVITLSPEEQQQFQAAVAELPARFADVWRDGLFERIVDLAE